MRRGRSRPAGCRRPRCPRAIACPPIGWSRSAAPCSTRSAPSALPAALSRWPRGRATRPPAVVNSRTALLVGAADIQDPGNLGAVIRAAEAGGATGVVTTPGGADPFGWKAAPRLHGQRVSAARRAGSLGRRDGRRRESAQAGRSWPLSGTVHTPMYAVDFTKPTLICWAVRDRAFAPALVDVGRHPGLDSDDGARRVAQRRGGGGAAGLRGATAAHNRDDARRDAEAARRRRVASDQIFGLAPRHVAV